MKKQDIFRIQVIQARWEEVVGYMAGIGGMETRQWQGGMEVRRVFEKQCGGVIESSVIQWHVYGEAWDSHI